MKKLLLSFAFFPLFLPSFSFSSVKNVVESSGNTTMINSTEARAEGSNAKTESSVNTTVNGENVTVKTNQPGSVEVKNLNGKVEIKTSNKITPTIIITSYLSVTPIIKVEDNISFNERKNVRVIFIYNLLKGFLSRFLRVF